MPRQMLPYTIEFREDDGWKPSFVSEKFATLDDAKKALKKSGVVLGTYRIIRVSQEVTVREETRRVVE